MGEPTIDQNKPWNLTIDGLVARPLSLSIEDLQQFPQVETTAFHKCAGSPFYPLTPTPSDVGNVVWTGVRLSDILHKAQPHATASFVWSSGMDFGSFRGEDPQHYSKDLCLERAMQPEVLLATHLNRQPLTRRHGGPVRLVVPGYYGTNSVKWLISIRVESERVSSIFTTKYYTDKVLSADGGKAVSRPVWAIAPDSAIVSPAPESVLSSENGLVIFGWAWGDSEISSVDLSFDGGKTWETSHLDPRAGYSWQGFRLQVGSDLAPGSYKLLSRATDRTGCCQPITGARNASVPVEVTIS